MVAPNNIYYLSSTHSCKRYNPLADLTYENCSKNSLQNWTRDRAWKVCKIFLHLKFNNRLLILSCFLTPRKTRSWTAQMSSRVDCFVSQTLNAASWKFFDLPVFYVPRWTGFKGAVTMELFSRRRWRLALAQVVSCDIYEMPKQLRLFMNDSNQIRQIQASPS